MEMVYTREAMGTVAEAAMNLEAAVEANQFGVINVVGLKGKMQEKGVEFGPAYGIQHPS